MVAPEDSDRNTTLIIWSKPLGFDERTITMVDPVQGERVLGDNGWAASNDLFRM